MAEEDQAGAEVSEEEADALLDESGQAESRPAPGEVVGYDLVASERIVRGRMPTLDRVNERWVDHFQTALHEKLMKPVEVRVDDVQVLRYGDWLAGLPGGTNLNLLSVNPWQGSALIGVEARLLYLLVDSYYGGLGNVPENAVDRPPTPVELRLNDMLVRALLENFSNAFKPISELRFELVRSDINHHYVSIATASESVIAITVHVELVEQIGQMSFIMPLSLLEPVREKLDEELKTSTKESQTRWYQSLRIHLDQTRLDLATVFLRSSLTLREVLSLKPGDVLPIEMPKTASLCAGSKPLLLGKFGTSRGYNAIKVIEAVEVSPNKLPQGIPSEHA